MIEIPDDDEEPGDRSRVSQHSNANQWLVRFVDSLYDSTLDRSWSYDQVGRLTLAYTGKEANGIWGSPDGPYAQGFIYDVWGNMTSRYGWGGPNPAYSVSYNSKNQNPGFTYDPAGNLTVEGGWQYGYDATGQQATSSAAGYSMTQTYDGDRLRLKRVENGNTTFYLRSSVLGGQVVCELSSAGGWARGYVYLGGQMLAIQWGGVYWVHQEPYSKGQRITNTSGTVITTVELDPFGGDTYRSTDTSFPTHRFTSYERDGNITDDAMNRRYHVWWSRMDQPDPYDGSYNAADPQSFNRYAYVQSDPVNHTDPSGLEPPVCMVDGMTVDCNTAGMIVGSGAGV